MTPQLSGLLTDKLTGTLAIVAGSVRPTGAGDGIDITKWGSNGGFMMPRVAMVKLLADAACTLTAPAAGLDGIEQWGYVLSTWCMIGQLRGGADIHLAGAAQGYAEQVFDVSAATRLAIVGSFPGGRTVLYQYCPVYTIGGG